MGIGKIGAFVMVALISAVLTFFVVRLGGGDAQRCDIHPHLSAKGFAALKSNLERARRAAHDAALTDKKDGDQANREGEAAAVQSFVDDLHDAVAAEYTRHRQALDSCF